MGQSLDLHPLVVLVGVVVGASFAGVLGAFLAAPVLASLKILGWYAHAKISDQDPFARPAPTEAQLVPTQAMTSVFSRLFGRKTPPPPPPAAGFPATQATPGPEPAVGQVGSESSEVDAA
jgi:hypothetical protein